MISKEMQQALNEQLNKEFYSAYIYLGMSAYASSRGFNGCANWFNTQYQEEVTPWRIRERRSFWEKSSRQMSRLIPFSMCSKKHSRMSG